MSAGSFKTVKKAGHSEITEKKSVFIGDVVHISDEEEAKRIIEEKRKAYRDARHVAFAYTVGNMIRFSDDGEPQGTAGAPILDVIKKNGVSDVLITVVRIFGGILLGAGGLVRAYSSAASSAFAASDIAVFTEYAEYSVKIEYTEYQKILYEINSCRGKITDSDFSDNVTVCFAAPADISAKISENIFSLTNGKRKPEIKKTYFDEELPDLR